MKNETLKNIINEFFQNELKEIRENKVRVTATVFFSLTAIFFMLFDNDVEQVNLSEPSKTEESRQNEKVHDDKVIAVKKNNIMTDGKNISIVIGANSDDLYIRDPFAVAKDEDDEPETEDTEKKISVISSDTVGSLPPIPYQCPILPEKSKITEEFILTGIAIGSNAKNAIVKKISLSEGKVFREEDIIVEVGDYIQGRQIADITEDFLIFSDGGQKMNISGFGNSTAYTENLKPSSTDFGVENNSGTDKENEEILPEEIQQIQE